MTVGIPNAATDAITKMEIGTFAHSAYPTDLTHISVHPNESVHAAALGFANDIGQSSSGRIASFAMGAAKGLVITGAAATVAHFTGADLSTFAPVVLTVAGSSAIGSSILGPKR